MLNLRRRISAATLVLGAVAAGAVVTATAADAAPTSGAVSYTQAVPQQAAPVGICRVRICP
ncbi:hypothetical protein [Kutzneria sp. NPDC052558]|uniref:hypothetical protein n=1 Tax=Kutzneria sp. NPDC052558 TaxID=3364121 RepID=UPI0037CB08F9